MPDKKTKKKEKKKEQVMKMKGSKFNGLHRSEPAYIHLAPLPVPNGLPASTGNLRPNWLGTYQEWSRVSLPRARAVVTHQPSGPEDVEYGAHNELVGLRRIQWESAPKRLPRTNMEASNGDSSIGMGNGHRDFPAGNGTPGNGHSGLENGYDGHENGNSELENGYNGPENGYDEQKNGYDGHENSNNMPENSYNGPQNGYDGQGNGYDGHENGYNGPANSYTAEEHIYNYLESLQDISGSHISVVDVDMHNNVHGNVGNGFIGNGNNLNKELSDIPEEGSVVPSETGEQTKKKKTKKSVLFYSGDRSILHINLSDDDSSVGK